MPKLVTLDSRQCYKPVNIKTHNPIQTNFRKMSEHVTKTPAARMACEKSNCDKSYVNKGSFKNHTRIHHQPGEFIASPLGNFPPLVLFNDTPMYAVQGNSAGDINSPPVTSVAKFVCQTCENYYEKTEDLNHHIEMQHGPENVDLCNILEETEDAIIAKELEDIIEKVKFLYQKDCHECNMRKEIEAHKELELNKKDSTIEMLER